MKNFTRILKTLKSTLFIIFFTSFTFFSSKSAAQDNFEGILYNFVEENGNSSLQPYADALSPNINSGLFHTAKLGRLNLNGDYSIGKTNAVTAGFGFAF